MSRSWLISNGGLDAGMVRSMGIVVMIVTLTGFALTALATVGWLVPSGWWAPLLVASAASSSVMLALFFSPALLLGFAINVALWALVLTSHWTPVATRMSGTA